jgi:DNA-binding NarL/FixJ family response regulator
MLDNGGDGVLLRIYIADSDAKNVQQLKLLLESAYGVVPDIWRSQRGQRSFFDNTNDNVVLIRVDDPSVPGLALTREAVARGPGTHVVWMAESAAHAVEGFRYGAEAYLLLPATGATLREAFKSLNYKANKV